MQVQTAATRQARSTVGAFDSSALLIGLVAVHVLVGVLASRSSSLATMHSLASLLGGLLIAGLSRRVEYVCYAASYVAGSEVMWRMAGARTFYEVGKYTIAVMFFLALLRLFSQWRNISLPLLYVVLLLPSAYLTIQAIGANDEARQQLSFNLAGPIALGIAVLFFSQIKANRKEVSQIAWSLLLPIVSITTIAMMGTYGENVDFSSNSNYATSGGFGPNQVSAILGLGAIMALIVALTDDRTLNRMFALGLGGLFLTQAILTFSRGGVYNAVIAILLGLIFYLRQPGARLSAMAVALVIFLVGFFLILPQLNTFTDGFLEERYTSTDPSNRLKIIQADLEVWRDNPLFGVGPGMARSVRGTDRVLSGQSHTEFTRALAEHGIAGLLSLVVLVLIVLQTFVRARSPVQRAFIAMLSAWAFAEMTHSATRVAAISLVFGLACIGWKEVKDDDYDAGELSSPDGGDRRSTPRWEPRLGNEPGRDLGGSTPA